MASSVPEPETPSGGAPWEQWNRERAVKTSLSLSGAGLTAAFLALGGTFLFNPVLRSSPSSFEKVVGAFMVLASMALLVTAPLTVARLRRTTPWKLATVVGILLAARVGLAVFF